MKSGVVRGLVCAAACGAWLIVSCGGDDDSGGTPSGSAAGGTSSGGTSSGGSGSGGMAPLQPVVCGDVLCQPVSLGSSFPGIAACCADESKGQCGLSTSLLSTLGAEVTQGCEPLRQPGVLDSGCPNIENYPVPDTQVTVSFQGCCRRDSATCGYWVDKLVVIPVDLGCVDSTPFLSGLSPAACDPSAANGGAGSGGQGGAGGGS